MDRNHMLATGSTSTSARAHASANSERRAFDAAHPAPAASASTSLSPVPVDPTPTPARAATTSSSSPSQLPPLHPHHHQKRHHLPVRQPPPPSRINLPSPSYARPHPRPHPHPHLHSRSYSNPSAGTSIVASGPYDYSSMSMRSPPPPGPDPTAKLPPLAHHDGDDKMLPSLSSITGPQPPFRSDRPADGAPAAPSNWSPTTLNTTNIPYRQPPQQPSRADSPATTMDHDGSNSVTSANSPDRQNEGTPTSLTLDDPDVRLAAEALGDLRADFVSSPPDTSGPMSPPPSQGLQPGVPAQKKPAPPEPLLSLLTTAHPFVASTIGNASSAYGGVKNYSPRFKSSAEYVEGYLTPLAKTVNRVGRRTGVEGGVRWFLGSGRRHEAPTSDPDSAGNSKKRRKVAGEGANGSTDDVPGSGDASPPTPKSARRLSSTSTVDTLPAYDEQRSPAYTENAVVPTNSAAQNQAWQTRLLMSTSGLSVAMSAESLRSLKYCLRWLRWTNDHMGKAIGSLKDALEEYESACNTQAAITNGEKADEDMNGTEGGSGTKTPEEARTEIANRIQVIKADILKTLQEVTNTVSKYAGGALPENARILVRRHLTSLPQRFRLATLSENGAERNGNKDIDSSLRDGAQKVLVLAKEGLDMVTQISGVLDGTIVSAEDWCERMGKRRPSERDENETATPTEKPLPPPIEANGDVKMG